MLQLGICLVAGAEMLPVIPAPAFSQDQKSLLTEKNFISITHI
jgi:hypothetical protein